MKHYKHLTIILVAIFFLATPLAAAPANPAQDTILPATETYTRAQVDSLINEAFSKNLDTLVELKTWEHYNTYTNDVNNRLTWVAILVTIVAIVAPLISNRRLKETVSYQLENTLKLLDEKQNTSVKLIEERQKDSKEYINQYVKDSISDSKERINQIFEEKQKEVSNSIAEHEAKIAEQQLTTRTIQERMLGLAKSAKESKNEAEKSARYAEFSILLTKAITNKETGIPLDLLTQIIDKYKDDSFVSFAYNCRGNLYTDTKDYKKSISDYTEAIKINPNYVAAYNNRGTAYEEIGDYDNALSDYNTVMKMNPNLAVVYNNRGNVYRDKGDFDKAIVDYSEAIKLNPFFARAYNNRGKAYTLNGNMEKAMLDYNKAIELNPDFSDAYFQRGKLFEAKGDKTKANSDIKRAKELGYKE